MDITKYEYTVVSFACVVEGQTIPMPEANQSYALLMHTQGAHTSNPPRIHLRVSAGSITTTNMPD